MMKNETMDTVEATAPVRKAFKIVINTCFGGFGLSDEATTMLRERKGIYADELARDDADLVAVVEALGDKANTRYSLLKVVEVPVWLRAKGWHIEEYDGSEHIAEDHRTWC